MAGPIAKLYATLGLDAREFTKGVDTAQGKLKSFGSAAATGLGLGAGLSATSAITSGIGSVVDGITSAIGAASDWEEANSKVGVVFETMSEDVRAFAGEAATSMGMAEGAALDALGTFGNFTQALGLSEAASADMSKAMVQLAADLGSFNNVASEDVLLALRSGLSGEAEPLRRFGVALSETAVAAELVASGAQKVAGEWTAAQKVQGRYAIIMRQTSKAQGDFARTSDGLANSQRILDARMADVQVRMGRALMPAAKLVTDAFGGLVDVLEVLSGDRGGLLTAHAQQLIAVERAAEGAAAAEGALAATLAASEGHWALTGTLADSLVDGINAIQDSAPAAAALRDLTAELLPMATALGDDEMMLRTYILTMQAAGKTTDEIRAHVHQLWESLTGREAERARLAMATLPMGDALIEMQEYSRRWQGEYAARLSAMYGTALRETEGKSPFEALFDGAEEDVRDAFKVATEAVAKGMGAIKAALKDPPQIIGDRQREENMEARLREVVRRVREATVAGDSMTARFYERLRAKQQLQLDNLRGRSRVTMGEVRKDYEKAGVSVEGTWADANFVMTEASRKAGAAMVEHMRSAKGDIERLDWVQTGTDMMTRLGIGFGNAAPFVFAAADRIAADVRDRLNAPAPVATAPAATSSDSITVTVNGPVYGGDAGLRELERRVERAVRQTGRERRHKQLAEG
jgi:hypothetical protein